MSRTISNSMLLLLSLLCCPRQTDGQAPISPRNPQTSSGGAYAVEGVIGPPEGTALGGGSYAVTEGFFSPAVIVESPGAPTMKIHLQGNDIVITWSGAPTDFNLEKTPALGAAWSTVSAAAATANGEIKVTIPLNSENQFLRLKSANP